MENEKHKDAKGVRDIKSFLQRRGSNGSGDEANFDGIVDIQTSPPIADLYPETTVFFADIAGFTKWSSSRSPDQVFRMLETLYGSFDKIARAYRIFKVETIGDSYVAVAGLPDPMKNHATVMVRFSIKVLSKMSEVMHALSHELGPETVELNLRVGLNSGPTTAGVLRGEKSRFQLFGDTVNTAARMESNGSPGRIHVSQSTADYLTAAGKGVWIRKREDLIVAKGKGTMQTYWIQVTAFSSTNTTISYKSISSDPMQGTDANSRHERSLDGYSMPNSMHERSVEARPDSLHEKTIESDSRSEI
jgi:class 3 adenylate cyclase